MPGVDDVVVLDTGVGALPGRLGDLVEQFPGVDLLDDLAGGAGAQPELGARLDRGHELVGDPHRVVGVLVLHGGDVPAAEVHVEAGVAQRPDLVLLAGLGLDELLDVRVVDVQDHHLRGASGGAAGLDGSGRGVGSAHEGHGSGCSAAGAEQLLGGTDAGEVQAGPGAALEDDSLLLVPVEDGLHGVVDAEDKAGGDLLRRVGADVEPHRRVEGEVLVQQQPGQLLPEDLGVPVGGEVAVVPPGPDVPPDDAVDEGLEAGFAPRSAEGPPEVLVRHDGGGVHAPEIGELHAALLEDHLAGLPVGLDHVARLPGDLVVGVHTLGGEHPLDGETHPEDGLFTGASPVVGGFGHSGGHFFLTTRMAEIDRVSRSGVPVSRSRGGVCAADP